MIYNHVHIVRRFRRSIRIDSDLSDKTALEGFICPKSSADTLIAMAQHVSETGQGAFTWTGPYGSGKSSLAIALVALLSTNISFRKSAVDIFGRDVALKVWNALPVDQCGWRILPVVGYRSNPVNAIGEAMRESGFIRRRQRGGWTERYITKTLFAMATDDSKECNGIILLIDEMGKFLESAVHAGHDINVFQQLAEAASRSKGRLLVIGVLHQSFAEYAHQLSSELRDEWTKIQGRFIDLSINAAGDEQINLISRAIQTNNVHDDISGPCNVVAKLYVGSRVTNAAQLSMTLERCWPLHPVVACLLGPISRRRFGQNQRSIFGFLNSAEPHGFQHFLKHAQSQSLYCPNQLWDYLRVNLEPSILASPDGHRWAIATDALERCESVGGDDLHVRLLKTIAIVDLFKERSSLSPSISLIRTCFPNVSDRTLLKTLRQLAKWSLVIFKKYLDAYAVYAGSDFDIEEAIKDQIEDIDSIDFSLLASLSGQQPILAKRHYHETGTLRWFEINLAPLHDVVNYVSHHQLRQGYAGQFVLAVAVNKESEANAHKLCREAARCSGHYDIVVGYSARSQAIVSLSREFVALEKIRTSHPEISGDSVAREEVDARLDLLHSKLVSELRMALNSAAWHRKQYRKQYLTQSQLNRLASELADSRFDKCPVMKNELLNRQKPSGSAVAAQNALLRGMVLHEGKPLLGISGYPAERGLFESLIKRGKIYSNDGNNWQFKMPTREDPCRLLPIWKAAIDQVKGKGKGTVTLAEIYDLWRSAPYGVKDGLMNFIAIAFILSQRNNIAIYREKVFRTQLDDVDIDYLVRDPSTIRLRWVDLSTISRRLLSKLAEIIQSVEDEIPLADLEPIDVARGLVRIYENLPTWTKRTMHLSKNTIRVRELLKRASDPNKFLFDDIPTAVCSSSCSSSHVDISSESSLNIVVENLQIGIEELVLAYESMLQSLKAIMFAELQASSDSEVTISELRKRAENIRGIAGDFRVEAFVGRISHYDGTNNVFEGIVSLAVNKPPSAWVDMDIDRAAIEIAGLARHFIHAETFARVKGRLEKRHAMAMILGKKGQSAPIVTDFQVGEADKESVELLIRRISRLIEEQGPLKHNVVLAALAELSGNYSTSMQMKYPEEHPAIL